MAVIGLPRSANRPLEPSLRGAGLLTHVALGNMRVDDIPSMVEIKATYEPDPAASKVYAELLKEFVNLYDKTKAIHKRLNGHRLQAKVPVPSKL